MLATRLVLTYPVALENGLSHTIKNTNSVTCFAYVWQKVMLYIMSCYNNCRKIISAVV